MALPSARLILLSCLCCVSLFTPAALKAENVAYADSLARVLDQRLKAGLKDSHTVAVIHSLVNYYFTADPAKAYEYANITGALAKSMDDIKLAAAAFNQLGHIYSTQGLHEQAIEFYIEGLSIYERTGDSSAITYTQTDIGNVYYDMGAMDLALKAYQKAMKIADARQDHYARSMLYNNYALVSYKKDKEETARCYLRALDIRLNHLDDEALVVQSYRYLGEIYYTLDKTDSALYYLQLGEELAGRLKEYSSLTLIEYARVRLFLIHDRLDEADRHVKKALRYAYISGQTYNLPALYYCQARVWEKRGQVRRGLPYLDTAYNIAVKYHYLKKQEMMSNHLSRFYEKLGDHARALYYLKIYNEIKDSSFSQESLNKIIQLQVKYELSKKDLELGNAGRETIIQEAELEKKRNINALLSIFGIFIILIGAGLVWGNFTKNRTTSDLKQKNEIIQRQTDDLRKARQLAESSLKAKSSFLSNMSHEIRTPMNAIIGFTDLIFLELPKDKTEEYLVYIRHTSNRLLQVINDILDISKIESGKMALEELDFSLKELARSIEKHITPMLDDKQLAYSIKIDNDIPDQLSADPTRIRQMLLNLLDNAIKFTEAGKVELYIRKVQQQQDRIELVAEIKDTGIGISGEWQNTIFESFEQAEKSAHRKFGGTGLGLPITRKLAELMGGHIKLDSTPGSGSVFYVYFWVKQPQNKPTVPITKAGKAITRPLRILYVEDNVLNQIYLKKLLEKWGHHPQISPSAEEALVILGSASFDLILMDIQLNGMDGLSATRLIRRREESQHMAPIPIYGLTADISAEIKLQAEESGMNGLLEKPVNTAELQKVLHATGNAVPAQK